MGNKVIISYNYYKRFLTSVRNDQHPQFLYSKSGF